MSESISFTQSCINECVFSRDDITFIIYVDVGIFLSTSDDQLARVIKELMDVDLQIEDQGHPDNHKSTLNSFQMVCISFPNNLLLIPSLPMWDLSLKILPNLYQQKAHSDSMHS
ncbi:hypothetical protein ACHAW6_011877 [Cyclotella cf. meneghiniana]